MNPPPTIAPLKDRVATTGAGTRNESIRAGDEAATQGRDTVWITSTFDALGHGHDVENPIDYDAGVDALNRSEPIDDEVVPPYRSPFE